MRTGGQNKGGKLETLEQQSRKRKRVSDMAFWGVLVKYDEPLTVVVDATTPYTRLRFSQAVLDSPRTLLPSNDRHILCCQVGEKPPIAVCSLRAVESEMGRLDLEFKHPEIIVLTIKGAQDIFVSGYYFEDYHAIIMPQIFGASNREEVAASISKLLVDPPTQNEPHITSGGQHLIASTSNPKNAKEKEVMQSREHVEENVGPRIQVVTSGEKLALESSLKGYAQEAPIEQGVAHVHEIASTSTSNKAKEKEVEQFIELVEENAGPRVQVLTSEEKHASQSSLKDLYAEDAPIEEGVAYVQEIASCYISNKAESVDLLKLDYSVEVHVEENTGASQVVTTGERFCLESSLQDYAQVTTQDASVEHVVAHVQEPVDKSPAVGMDVEDEQFRNASPMSFILLKRPQTALTTARVEKTQLTSAVTEENKWTVVAGLCAIPKPKEVKRKRKQMEENEQMNVDVQSADANDEKNRSHNNARDSKEVKKMKPEVVQNVVIQLEANNDETTSCKENVFLPPPVLCLSIARDEEVPRKKKKKMMEKHMHVQSIDTDNENKRSNCDVHDSKKIQKKAKVIQDSTMLLEVNNDETFSDVHDSKEIQKKKKKKAKVIQDSTMQLEVNNDETFSDVHDSKEMQKKRKKAAKVIQNSTMQLEVNNDVTVSDVHDSKEIQKKKKAKVIQDSKMSH